MRIRSYIPAIVVMYILFFMIAFVTGLHNPLGVIIKSQYDIPMGVAQLGNFANFIAYAFMGLPAGLLLKKYGYKVSSLAAVTVGILGLGLLFLSGQMHSGLWVYYLGAFVSGFSMCMLNTVVNPMLNFIGGGGNRGNQLLQFGGSLNSLAATIVPFVIGTLMGRSVAAAQGERPHFEISDANPVFIVLISIFAIAILMILFTDIPEYKAPEKHSGRMIDELIVKDSHSCFSFRHFILGSVAVFLYVGVEVGIANMTNLYLIHEVGLRPVVAGLFVAIYWFLMFVGRLLGGYLGARFSSRDMLSFSSMVTMILLLVTIFTPEKITLSIGRYNLLSDIPVNVVFLIMTGLFTSVMWGSIFNLSVEGLGKYTTTASGFFMMMVCGGGIVPLLQAFLADLVGCRASFWLLLLCVAYLMYYGSTGYRNVNRNIPVD